MRVLIALTYFQPWKSGLTVYAVRLAQALAARGHTVKVLTSHYRKDLPVFERMDGIEVIRMPVIMRISKGVIMPTLPFEAWKLIRESDVINLHVPQFDAAIIALLARLAGKPVVVTYQCDLLLPAGLVNWVANRISYLADRVSAACARVIVSMSQDYAENSIFLPHYLDKVRVVLPPIVLPTVTEEDVRSFQKKNNICPGEQIIGLVARLATEKGVEYLVEAMPMVLEKFPKARVLSAGQYQNVVGEEAYAQKIMPLIKGLGDHWTFLGVISDQDLAALFHTSHLTVLPSINSTESFGMVQVESMVCGTPVVASDLPGIRQPILETKMGRIVPPKDPKALAQAIISILDEGERDRSRGSEIAIRFSPQSTASNYEAIFKELLNSHGEQ